MGTVADAFTRPATRAWAKLDRILIPLIVAAVGFWGISHIQSIDGSSHAAATSSKSAATSSKSAATNAHKAAVSSQRALTLSELNSAEITRHYQTLEEIADVQATSRATLTLLEGEITHLRSQVSYESAFIAYLEDNLAALCHAAMAHCIPPPKAPSR